MSHRKSGEYEWEVVRYYRAPGVEELLSVLLTPVIGNPDNPFDQGRWAQWRVLPRSRFGDHVAGVRITI